MDVELLNLIDRYWDLAYAEGKEGRDHDTEEGDAALCRYEIEKRLRDIEVAVAQAVEFAEYVERQAKGAMVDAAKRFLSAPYAEELRQRLNHRHSGGDREDIADASKLVDGWRPVSEIPPHNRKRDSLGTEYLIYPPTSGGDQSAFFGCRLGGKACWYRYGAPLSGITHWRPLPEPPSEDAA